MQTLLEQLAELETLAAAATPAPWAAETLYEDEATVFFDENGDGICPNPYQPICKADDLSDDYAEPNAAFIAAARNFLTPESLTLLTAALAAPQWVAVTDRLPEPEKSRTEYSPWVLGYCEGRVAELSYYYKQKRWMRPGSGWELNVTHWMPLPTPPAA